MLVHFEREVALGVLDELLIRHARNVVDVGQSSSSWEIANVGLSGEIRPLGFVALTRDLVVLSVLVAPDSSLGGDKYEHHDVAFACVGGTGGAVLGGGAEVSGALFDEFGDPARQLCFYTEDSTAN